MPPLPTPSVCRLTLSISFRCALSSADDGRASRASLWTSGEKCDGSPSSPARILRRLIAAGVGMALQSYYMYT